MENYLLKENTSGRFAAFTVGPGIRVGLKSGNDQYIFDDIGGEHKVVEVGGWLAERHNKQIGLRLQKSNPADLADIMIVFKKAGGGSSANVKVGFIDQSGANRVIAKENVKKLTFSPKSLTIESADEEPASAVSTAEDRQEDLRKALQESHARENALRKRNQLLEQTVRDLFEENQTLKKNSALTGQIGTEQSALEDLNHQLESANERLQEIRSELAEKRRELADTSKRLQDAQEELTNASNGLKDAGKDLADAEKKLKDTKEKMEETRSQKAAAEDEHDRLSQALAQEQTALDKCRSENEVTQLDIDKTRKEIRSIQERLADDTLTAEAMEDDAAIGTGSVKNSLEKAAANLRNAEKKIEVIIKLRETINSRVQDAVVRKGTEFLSGQDEAGGQ